jgi:hypothetical protein
VPLFAWLQVIAVICVLVWVMNINRFNDPALGGWVEGAASAGKQTHDNIILLVDLAVIL